MAATTLIDRPPRDRLGPDCAIAGVDDVDRGFAELVWLASKRKTRTAALDQRVRLLKAELDKELRTRLTGADGETAEIAFADREKALREAIESWCTEHAAALQEEAGAKTLRFPHGKVAWKEEPAAVQPAEGEDARSVAVKLGSEPVDPRAKAALLEIVARALARIKILDGRPLAEFVQVSIAPRMQAFTALAREGTVDAEALAPFGLRIVAAHDKIRVAPDESTLEKPAEVPV